MNMKFFCSVLLVMISGVCLNAENHYIKRNGIARIASYVEGIVDMKVVPGQKVKEGQLLFEIKTDYLETLRNKCKNSVWYYTETYKRMKDLHRKRSESLENLQDAEYDIVRAIGDLKKEELLINHWSKYYAPFDGVVTKIYYFTGSAVPDSSGSPNTNNAVMEITKTDVYNQKKDAGLIKNSPLVAHIASMVDGIVEMKVADGEKVKAGQVLFSINMDYNKIVRTQQEANLKLCKAKLEREKRLNRENANALKDYQTAEFNYVNALEDLNASNIIINKRSVYKAPFDGTVTSIVYYSGSNTFAGHTVVEVTTTNPKFQK